MNDPFTPPPPVLHVASDEPPVLGTTSCLLCMAGLTVQTITPADRLLDWPLSDGCGCVVLGVAAGGGGKELELHRAIASRGVARPVIFLSGGADARTAVRAMKQGAHDFLISPVREDELIRVVRDAVETDRVAWRRRRESADVWRRLAGLTPREREVFVHVISGRLNKQTAAELGTVEKTIKVHRAHVMEKLGVASLADLVRLAERAAVAPLPGTGTPSWSHISPAVSTRSPTAGSGAGTKVQ